MQPNTNSFVKTHQPCPDKINCGSTDGAAVNADGSVKCFSCNGFFGSKESHSVATVKPNATPVFIPRETSFNQLKTRSISKETACYYGVKTVVDASDTDTIHYYPYALKDSKAVAFKIRDVATKGFTWRGKPEGAKLFGQDLFRPKGKYVTLVEGECDAMAAYELLGSKWPVVSVRSGAAAGISDVRENLEFLESFENVVICFDNDDVGIEAAENIAKVLTPGKAKIFKHDKDFKDPNEYLIAKQAYKFVDNWWAADLYTPAGVLNAFDSVTEYANHKSKAGVLTPWNGLNAKTEGLRAGELVTITGGTGLGKSTITRELSHHFIKNSGKPVGILALEENWHKTIDGLLAIEANAKLHLHSVKKEYSTKQLEDLSRSLITPDNLWVYGHHGVTDIESIFAKLRFMILGCGCQIIILDHLHMLVLADKEQDERKGIDNIMGRLRAMCEETQATIILVSHLKRLEGNKGHENGVMTGLSHLRGSQSIGQLSDTVIGIERDQQSEDPVIAATTTMRLLKCRETGDVGIACHLYYNKDTGRLEETEASLEEQLVVEL